MMMKIQYLAWQFLLLSFALHCHSNGLMAKSDAVSDQIPLVMPIDGQTEAFWLSQSIRLPRTNSGRPNSTAGAGTRLYLPSPDESLLNGSNATPAIDVMPEPPIPQSDIRGGVRGGLQFLMELPKFQSSFCSDAQPISLFQSSGQNLTTTLSNQPTLWFAIPAPELTPIAQVRFRLFNFSGELLYEKFLDYGSNQAGLLKVDLPEGILGEEGDLFDWDLQLICQDQSVSTSIEGLLSHSNWNDPYISFFNDNYVNILDTLRTTDSYLSFTQEEREHILDDLEYNNPWKALFRFQILLGEHLRNLQTDYAEIDGAIVEFPVVTEDSSDLSISEDDLTTLDQLKAQRKQMVLEMVQIYVWFGAWSDALNLLLIHREEYPDEWHLFLENMLGNLSMEQEDLISIIKNLPVMTLDLETDQQMNGQTTVMEEMPSF
jgi:Domain of Unknown Function (DUF928)